MGYEDTRNKGHVTVDSRPLSKFTVLFVFLAGCLFSASLPKLLSTFNRDSQDTASLLGESQCKVPLPNVLAYTPPSEDNPFIQKAASLLEKALTKRTSEPDIDSLSIAVVTSDGILYEGGFGSLKANATDPKAAGKVDRHSIYRIASITKLFTVLETLILRERSVLTWDDPVDKFLPSFTYPAYGWSEYLNGKIVSTGSKPPITLRQLASHMAGIGRDYPPQNEDNWPIFSGGPGVDLSGNSIQKLLKNIAKYPLINPPYTYPVYSNTGIDILGFVNVAANIAAGSTKHEPKSHAELIERDILMPLGMNSSFYSVPYGSDLIDHLAIPSKNSTWADFVFSEASVPAGGQYSSVADLAKLMQTLLSPTAKGGVISDYVVREWLRPLHAWPDNIQEVGAPWEIFKIDQKTRIYSKGGNLPGYHSSLTLNPQFGYGIAVLMTGQDHDAQAVIEQAIDIFQPAFAELQKRETIKQYAGVWQGEESEATTTLIDGALFLTKLNVRGIDVLAVLGYIASAGASNGSAPIGLWSTGRVGEFRAAIGRPSLNKRDGSGCEPYWVTIDPGLNGRGAPVDLLYFENNALVYPSADVRFVRK